MKMIIVIIVLIGALFFAWALCRIGEIADENIEEAARREMERDK